MHNILKNNGYEAKIEDGKTKNLNVKNMQTGELKKLWKDTFGDSQKYIDDFFEKIYDENGVLIHREAGEVVSALYMIDYNLKYKGKIYKLMYLYALATKKEYRGRRIMSGLIDKADEIMHNKGYAGAFLIPAEEKLYDYYGQFGFTDIIFNKKYIKVDSNYIYNSYVECNDGNKIYKADEVYRNMEDARIVLSREQNEFMCETFMAEGGKIYINADEDKYIMADIDESDEKITIYSTNDYSLYDEIYVKSGLFKKNEEIFIEGFDVSKVILDKIFE